MKEQFRNCRNSFQKKKIKNKKKNEEISQVTKEKNKNYCSHLKDYNQYDNYQKCNNERKSNNQ